MAKETTQTISHDDLRAQKAFASRAGRNGSFLMLAGVALRYLGGKAEVVVSHQQAVLSYLFLAYILACGGYLLWSISSNAKKLGLSCRACRKPLDLNKIRTDDAEYRCPKCAATIRLTDAPK